MSRTKLSQNSIAAGAINSNTFFGADVVSPHAVANTSTYSVAELLVGGKILLDNVGKVGIGTLTPASYDSSADNLVVYESGHAGITIAANTAGNGSIYFADGTAGTTPYRGVIQYGHSADYMRFLTAATERIRIDNTGKVGIGTSSPQAPLHVAQTAGTLPSSSTNGIVVQKNAATTDIAVISLIGGAAADSRVEFGDAADRDIGMIRYTHSDNGMEFWTNTSEKMFLNSDGDLGIGVTSPDAKLDVYQAAVGGTGYQNGIRVHAVSGIDSRWFEGGGSDMGIGTHSNHSFALRTNNTARLTIAAGGLATFTDDILVGHTAQVNTGTNDYSQIHYSNKGNTLLLGEWSSTNASYPALRFLKSASSTIGTNAIVADGEHLGGIEFNAADGVDYISVAAAIRAYVNGTPGDSDMPGALTFDTTADGSAGTSERVRITSAGKVGIATTAPTGYLEIGPTGTNTESIILKRTQAGHNNIIKLMTSSTDDWIIGQRNSGSTSDFRFYSYGASNDVLTILRANGYVGIGAGVTAPEARLEVLGNSDSVAGIKIGANATHGWHFYDSSTNGDLHIKSEASGTQTEVIRFTRANQYVGIGTTSPSAKLDVVGEVQGSSGFYVTDGYTATGYSQTNTTDHGQYQAGFTDRHGSARASFEWGHSNGDGYGSTLACSNGGGAPYIGFSCGPGTVNNTWRTFGIRGLALMVSHGIMYFYDVADAGSNGVGQNNQGTSGTADKEGTDSVSRITLNATNGNASFSGAVSKGSGSFLIEHPLDSKKDTHNLAHSFIEGPQADLIYRGKVVLSSGAATVNIDAAAGMTSGTFEALCTDVQCFTSNETGWTAVKGSVSGATLTIQAQDNSCTDTISWMVVGERKDKHMIDTDWTDSNGKVIVEPLKPEDETP